MEGQRMLFSAVLTKVDGTRVVPRSGFGPRLIYLVGGFDGRWLRRLTGVDCKSRGRFFTVGDPRTKTFLMGI